MKTSILHSLALLIVATLSASGQGSAFTYQGILTGSTGAYTGPIELEATLWDAATNGTQFVTPRPVIATVEATNGLFTASLDFGKDAFTGAPRWLQINLRTAPDPEPFTTLWPRQKITATPYAMTASRITGTVMSENLIGGYSNVVSFENPGNFFAGQGSDLLNLNASQLTSGTVPAAALNNAWKIEGNAGTTPGTHFLGTTDNRPLEFRVAGTRALQLEPTAGLETVNVVGGSIRNFATPGVVGVTIGGGGAGNYFGAPYTNSVGGDFGTVGGGVGNIVGVSAFSATVAGGNANRIGNAAQAGVISGGSDNTVQLNALYATVGGGGGNAIQTNADYSTIGGGWANTAQINADYATVGGGAGNVILGSSLFATIPGGRSNLAASYSFAAGHRAKAFHSSSFVWADTQNSDFLSTSTNQFSVRASGGVRLDTGGAGATLDGQPVLSGTVTTTQLADGAVTSAKLLDGTALAELLDDDGPGSLLDADTLDGLNSTAFSLTSHNHDSTYWKLGGNAGTTPGTHFLGTTDNQPLEFRVSGLRALRLEDNGDGSDGGTAPDGAPNVVGGSHANSVPPGVVGATISGGGATNYANFVLTNAILADYGTVGGGLGNRVAVNSFAGTIAGGQENDIGANSPYSSIAGGQGNNIGTNSPSSAIGGGGNSIAANSEGSTIGGGGGNIIWTNSLYSTIAGGSQNLVVGASQFSTVGGGNENRIWRFAEGSIIAGGTRNEIQEAATNSVIGGGVIHKIGAGSLAGTIGGGCQNTIGSNNINSVIAGGWGNAIGDSTSWSFIGGGSDNHITTSNKYSTIGGGWLNTILAGDSTIGGGGFNDIHEGAASATIAGGGSNTILTNASAATIGGGGQNTIQPDGDFGTIPGGWQNSATNYAFAAGRRAKANHTGAFVWADSTDADFASTGSNQFLIRASGGVGINVTNPLHRLHVGNTRGTNAFNTSANVIAIEDARENGRATFLALAGIGGPDTTNRVEVQIEAVESQRRGIIGTTTEHPVVLRVGNSDVITLATNRFIGMGTNAPIERLHVFGNILASGTITPNSDRNAKTDIASVDSAAILAHVAKLPIHQWRFKTEAEGVKHVGPMAQDFHAAFALGAHHTAIATVDADGVALAAIQGLNQKVDQQAFELRAKEAEVRALQARLTKVEELLGKLTSSLK